MLLIIIVAILFYPAICLLVALTGPHSKYERYEP